jgi:hypothetical protein
MTPDGWHLSGLGAERGAPHRVLRLLLERLGLRSVVVGHQSGSRATDASCGARSHRCAMDVIEYGPRLDEVVRLEPFGEGCVNLAQCVRTIGLLARRSK